MGSHHKLKSCGFHYRDGQQIILDLRDRQFCLLLLYYSSKRRHNSIALKLEPYDFPDNFLRNIEEIDCLVKLLNLDKLVCRVTIGGQYIVIVSWLLAFKVVTDFLGFVET